MRVKLLMKGQMIKVKIVFSHQMLEGLCKSYYKIDLWIFFCVEQRVLNHGLKACTLRVYLILYVYFGLLNASSGTQTNVYCV